MTGHAVAQELNQSREPLPHQWFLYLILCADNSLYTGITIDIPRRFEQHTQGKGAKYLRGRGPLKVVFSEMIGPKSTALRLERRVKKFSRKKKELLLNDSSLLYT